MHVLKSLIIIVGIGLVTSCGNGTKKEAAAKAKDEVAQAKKELSIVERVDKTQAVLGSATADFDQIATLDHHRMAKEVGVYTPPAIAMIFSDKQINIDLLTGADPILGLDLPFKLLVYTEADTSKVSVAYTSGDFIAKRHGMDAAAFAEYNNMMAKVLQTVDTGMISETSLDSVQKGFGIIKIESDYDFATTMQNLKAIVKAQSDTRWFGEIDYQAAASKVNIDLKANTLLLFGGPAPGGKAMMTSPKIGLDAFCQKLLVYEDADGVVWVAFNDIVAFANLYYGTATKPQQMINQRLFATFSKAVKKAA